MKGALILFAGAVLAAAGMYGAYIAAAVAG